jgi:phosphoribosylformylglycinamidine synthase
MALTQKLSTASPFHGALYAVVDSVTKCSHGGDYSSRLTFQEYFERLGQDPKRWAKPFASLLGRLKRRLNWDSGHRGKDRCQALLWKLDVPPTLVSFAVAAADANHVISTELKKGKTAPGLHVSGQG